MALTRRSQRHHPASERPWRPLRATVLPLIAEPMLATPTDRLPQGAGWAYEMKWDGYRALARWDGRTLQLLSRTGNDQIEEFPELRSFGAALPGPAILDGELVALDDHGRPSF